MLLAQVSADPIWEVTTPVVVPTMLRPAWWSSAGCRAQGPRQWTMVRGETTNKLAPLRRICQACPVAGECLRAAYDESASDRHLGPVRVGTTGINGWRPVDKMVAQLRPRTLEDWTTVAAWVLDGDVR